MEPREEEEEEEDGLCSMEFVPYFSYTGTRFSAAHNLVIMNRQLLNQDTLTDGYIADKMNILGPEQSTLVAAFLVVTPTFRMTIVHPSSGCKDEGSMIFQLRSLELWYPTTSQHGDTVTTQKTADDTDPHRRENLKSRIMNGADERGQGSWILCIIITHVRALVVKLFLFLLSS
jgi:hypothetical protein